MTEKYWQERKESNKINDKNLNPILKQTFEDKKSIAPRKHFKALYLDCIAGSLDIKMWERQDDLSIEDMGMLACRDTGCELNYCQTSLLDPYEKLFENCDEQTKTFYGCMQREIRLFNFAPKAERPVDHLKIVLDNKKKTKYKSLFEPVIESKKLFMYSSKQFFVDLQLYLDKIKQLRVKKNIKL